MRIADALRRCTPGLAALLVLVAGPPVAGAAAAGIADAALRGEVHFRPDHYGRDQVLAKRFPHE